MSFKIGDLFGSWSPSAILKGIVMAILFALIALIVLIGFLVGGIRVLMTTLEFHIMTALVVIMLPFAVLSATSFLAERSFAIVVSLSVKMMVTLFILTLRSEEHTSELQSLMRISYAVFCLKKTKHAQTDKVHETHVT